MGRWHPESCGVNGRVQGALLNVMHLADRSNKMFKPLITFIPPMMELGIAFLSAFDISRDP